MSAVAAPTTSPPARPTRPRSRARIADIAATTGLWSLAIALSALLAFIFVYLLAQGLGHLSWRFLVTPAGVGPQLFNTFYMLILALAFGIPVALGAAIYLTQYAGQGPVVTVIRFAAETLAGVPSLILGLFGSLIFVTNFGEGHRLGLSRLAGAATLAILNLPLLMRVFEDALSSLPRELREGSLAVGATRVQTTLRVLIPAALPALTTGIVLTAGKMIGETAALIYTAGTTSGGAAGWFSLNPLLPGDTLTVRIFFLTAENPSPAAALDARATAALLVILLLGFNLGFRYLAEAVNRRLRGTQAARRPSMFSRLRTLLAR